MAAVEREVESKFQADSDFELPDLGAALSSVQGVEEQAVRLLRADYYDAEDLRLAREGITLRHRTGEGAARWTLKLPAGGAGTGLSRDEISVHDDSDQVPAELLDLLTARLRGTPLQVVAVLETSRRPLVLRGAGGQALVEVVDDDVQVLDGAEVVGRFRELEVERRADDGQVLRAVGKVLRRAGARRGVQVPKLVRALGERAAGPSELPAVPAVRPRDPAGDLVRLALATGLRRLVAADAGVRRDSPDAVHQMRVACRRLRSDLRTFGRLLDDPRSEPLREELAVLAGVLGGYRDLEVLRDRIRRTAEQDPLAPLDPHAVEVVLQVLSDRQQAAREAVLEALRDEWYVALLELLLGVAREPRLTAYAQKRCAAVLPRLVGNSWRSLARAADALTPGAPDEQWHRVRILAKRARYAAEAAAAVLPDASRTAKAAAAVQETVGEHQDAAVAAAWLLALADERPDDSALVLACGRLVERERAAVRASRVAFEAVWRDASRRRTTAWLRAA